MLKYLNNAHPMKGDVKEKSISHMAKMTDVVDLSQGIEGQVVFAHGLLRRFSIALEGELGVSVH